MNTGDKRSFLKSLPGFLDHQRKAPKSCFHFQQVDANQTFWILCVTVTVTSDLLLKHGSHLRRLKLVDLWAWPFEGRRSHIPFCVFSADAVLKSSRVTWQGGYEVWHSPGVCGRSMPSTGARGRSGSAAAQTCLSAPALHKQKSRGWVSWN